MEYLDYGAIIFYTNLCSQDSNPLHLMKTAIQLILKCSHTECIKGSEVKNSFIEKL